MSKINTRGIKRNKNLIDLKFWKFLTDNVLQNRIIFTKYTGNKYFGRYLSNKRHINIISRL